MKVLIVDDEPKIARILADYFEREGFESTILHEGDSAVEMIKTGEFGFVVLDVMLPGKDGLAICKEVRAFSDVPILMLTAKVEEIDRLLGLEFGADDYVCKPFSPREVIARARTILRRTQPTRTSDSVVRYGQLEVREDQFECRLDGLEIELTQVEFRVLCAMLAAPRRVFSRRQLMRVAYDDGRTVSERTIDSHMRNLRNKLRGDSDTSYVRTIYGIGYKLEYASANDDSG